MQTLTVLGIITVILIILNQLMILALESTISQTLKEIKDDIEHPFAERQYDRTITKAHHD